MNFPEIVSDIAKKTKKSKPETERFLNTLLENLQLALANGESVTLGEFGTFTVCTRAARKGKDPKTKKPIDIPACKTVRFTLGPDLKSALD